MTGVRTPPGTSSVSRDKPVPVAVAALTTGGWAAVVGAAPVMAVALVAWVADSRSAAPALDAVRMALNAWLLAHGATLNTQAGPFGLAPLALSVLAYHQLARAGGNSAKATGVATIGGGARVVVWLSLVYGGVGALVSIVSGMRAVHTDVVAAAVATAVFAAVSAASGVARVNGIGAQVLSRLPRPAARALPSGTIAAGLILGAGALLAGVCLALAAEDVATLFAAFSPGLVGSATLLGLSVLYAPDAAVWGASYIVGPGVAVGSGTSVSAIDVSLGPLPAFPLFAGLPTERASAAVSLLLIIPMLAGVIAGIAAARRRQAGERWSTTLLGAALSGPLAGLLLGVAAYGAGGPLGGGRLEAVGPSAWRVALVGAVEVTLFAVVGAALARIMYALSGRVPMPVTGVAGVSSDPEVDLEAEPVGSLAAELPDGEDPDHHKFDADGYDRYDRYGWNPPRQGRRHGLS